jgi:hypothetical protein
MAYDPAQGQVMFFGGEALAAGTELGQTWEWSGSAWIQKFPANHPGPLFKPALACDSSRQRVVLFGGIDGSNESSQTWEWDGTNWSQMNPEHSPPSRHHHAMAYDSKRKVVVLFGGYTSLDPATGQRDDLADTWEWNGADWTQMHPAHSPQRRDGHAMAYDENRDRIVLFGGAQDVSTLAYYQDTWEWDGTDWTVVPVACPPPARGGATLAYDQAKQKVLMFGGYTSQPLLYFNDTYAWDGTVWQKLKQCIGPSPVGRSDHAMAYDLHRQRMVMFGGFTGDSPAVLLGDTWER